jgi:hypothetical protein
MRWIRFSDPSPPPPPTILASFSSGCCHTGVGSGAVIGNPWVVKNKQCVARTPDGHVHERQDVGAGGSGSGSGGPYRTAG